MAPDAEAPKPKSSYAQFCDMLRHPSAKPVILWIRNFVTKFPEGETRLEAADRAQRFLSLVEQRMFSDIVVFAAESDEEGIARAEEGLEKMVFGRLYPKIFATDPQDIAADVKLHRQITALSWVELQHLGVPAVEPSLLPRAISELRSMDDYKAPRDKLICILNACRVLTDVLKKTWAVAAGGGLRPLSADDFLPLLIFLILRANPPRLHSNVEFVASFRHPSRLVGEDAYFITSIQSAKEFVRELRPDALEVSLEDYQKFCAEALRSAGLEESEQNEPSLLPASGLDVPATGPATGLDVPTALPPTTNGLDVPAIGPATGLDLPAAPVQPANGFDVQEAVLQEKSKEEPVASLAPEARASEPQQQPARIEEPDVDAPKLRLFHKREVMVYRVPPAASAAGHKAGDWSASIWKGRLEVVATGAELAIRMLESSSGELFAQCLVPSGEQHKFVEPVTDSSRYFVLKICNGQRHALIGLGFEQQNDAFDFKCVLSDFKRSSVAVDREVAAESADTPSRDLSLKEGEKLTVSLKGLQTRRREGAATAARPRDEQTTLLVPAPPAPPRSAEPPVAVTPQPCPVNTLADLEEFGDFEGASVQPQEQLFAPQSAIVAPCVTPSMAPVPRTLSSASPVWTKHSDQDSASEEDPFDCIDTLSLSPSSPTPAPESTETLPVSAAPGPAASYKASPTSADASLDPFAFLASRPSWQHVHHEPLDLTVMPGQLEGKRHSAPGSDQLQSLALEVR
mmetsp:Transcript_7209/g.15707  ORF Transcript_7209/g.15707 Transcript_7209/m.15707 type:complete len:743 (-) Transcript_7209:269-2497(-)